MKNLKKLKLLKELHVYKSLGFSYMKELKNTQTKECKNLPDSIFELQNMVLECHLCKLSRTRKNVVFGEGNTKAKIMFVGEGPGVNEDDTGKPFVGRAGELLTRIINNVLELQRENVYIANIVKCRPPGNRVPDEEEVEMCKAYLLKQIEIIKPAIIIALGGTSYQHLTSDADTSISKIRGEILDFAGAKLIPTFHPSYLLRNPSAKKGVYQDMLRVKKLLENLSD